MDTPTQVKNGSVFIDTISKQEIVGIKGKLILLPVEQSNMCSISYMFDGDIEYHLQPNMDAFIKEETNQLVIQPLKAYFISETEKINEGDYHYDIHSKTIELRTAGSYNDQWYRKVLVHHEQISHEDLIEIVGIDKRLKGGDTRWIECQPWNQMLALTQPEKLYFTIKLDEENLVSLYTGEEKTYTETEKNQAIWSAIFTMLNSSKFDGSYTSAKEWFDNNYRSK
jgi:hypothetical protein